MFNKPTFLSLALAAALVCSPLAFAASAPAASTSTQTTAMHGKHQRHQPMNLLQQLDLSDSQRTTVHQLMQQNFEQARPEMESVRAKREAFENTTPGSANYQSTANDLAQAESTAIHARVLRQATLRSKIYNLLTPAQRTKLASIRKQREARAQQWRETHMRHTMAPASPATSSH